MNMYIATGVLRERVITVFKLLSVQLGILILSGGEENGGNEDPTIKRFDRLYYVLSEVFVSDRKLQSSSANGEQNS